MRPLGKVVGPRQNFEGTDGEQPSVTELYSKRLEADNIT